MPSAPDDLLSLNRGARVPFTKLDRGGGKGDGVRGWDWEEALSGASTFHISNCPT